MKPLNNWVLLKVKIHNDKMRLEGGKILWLDTSYEPEKHSSVVCEVVAVPESLVYDQGPGSMPWDTEMDVQVGDDVIIHYLAYQNAFGKDGYRDRVISHNEEVCFFCRYENLFCSKRIWNVSDIENFFAKYTKDSFSLEEMAKQGIVVDWHKNTVHTVTMLNGYLACEPIEEEVVTTLILPEYLKRKRDTTRAIVRYQGRCNRAYLHYPDRGGDMDVLNSGDTVVLGSVCDIPLEYKDHRTFNGDKEYWRIQRFDIKGIIKDQSIAFV